MNRVGSRSRGAVRLVSSSREDWPVIGLFVLGAIVIAGILPWVPSYLSALWFADRSLLQTVRMIVA